MNIDVLEKDLLPHGSGINFEWEIQEAPGKITCKNAWSYMDEYGMYDDIFPFTVKFAEDASDFTLHFNGCTSNQYRKIALAGIREYLEDLFEYTRERAEKIWNV